MEQSKQLVTFVQELSWVINFKKSELTPTQKFDFLGYRFDLSKGKVSPTEKKWLILTTAIEGLNNSLTTTPRILMSFIGILASLEKTVPMSRLHMRHFQWYLKTHCIPNHWTKRHHVQTSDLVEKSRKCVDRSPPPPPNAEEHNLLLFTDARIGVHIWKT